MAITAPHGDLPLITRARAHRTRLAVSDSSGRYTYRDLLGASERVAAHLLQDARSLEEARVAFLCPPGVHYVATQWGVWRAGGIAVPLCVSHPAAELEYVIDDCGASVVVAHPDYGAMLGALAASRRLRFVVTTDALAAVPLPSLPTVPETGRALIVYTSGTTGKPKGVVSTHANIRAQVGSLIEAWGWHPDDHILSVLPLHHVHGIVNVVTCALWAGAHCEMLAEFDARTVWSRFVDADLTLFMAVPTIYRRLIAAWEEADPAMRSAYSDACGHMRLMVSGSAPLPAPTFERWREITGHTLLERYGMTETGMILSNPLDGERVPGSVGGPLPGVEVRLVSAEGGEVMPGESGSIHVRGPAVFGEYWERPDETREAFVDGWFITGDVAIEEEGRYRILGRSSVDIIKTGGYKVSALEIEDALRAHPDIAECAVVGIPDDEWGELVCVAVERSTSEVVTLETLTAWLKQRLAPYKIPRALAVVDALPRNVMGKVTKSRVAELFESESRPEVPPLHEVERGTGGEADE